MYFHTMYEAIQEARRKATFYNAIYYVYQAQKESPNLFYSFKPPAQGSDIKIKAKVLQDGSITYFGKAEDESNGGA